MVSVVSIQDLCLLIQVLFGIISAKEGVPMPLKGEGTEARSTRIKVASGILNRYRKQFITKAMISTHVVDSRLGSPHPQCGASCLVQGLMPPVLAQASWVPSTITRVTRSLLLCCSSCQLLPAEAAVPASQCKMWLHISAEFHLHLNLVNQKIGRAHHCVSSKQRPEELVSKLRIGRLLGEKG